MEYEQLNIIKKTAISASLKLLSKNRATNEAYRYGLKELTYDDQRYQVMQGLNQENEIVLALCVEKNTIPSMYSWTIHNGVETS